MSQQTRTLSISLIFNVHNILRERTMIQLEKTKVNTSSWMCTDVHPVLFDQILQKNCPLIQLKLTVLLCTQFQSWHPTARQLLDTSHELGQVKESLKPFKPQVND